MPGRAEALAVFATLARAASIVAASAVLRVSHQVSASLRVAVGSGQADALAIGTRLALGAVIAASSTVVKVFAQVDA